MAKTKSQAEAKVERVTWFALVVILGVLTLFEGIDNLIIPLSGAVVLFASGLYQYGKKWRVSPITWIAAALLLVAAWYNWQINPDTDLLPICLLIFGAVIGVGVLTGET